jgi:TRAP-type mannitol/chloroaromatic compound transport system permease small subunit
MNEGEGMTTPVNRFAEGLTTILEYLSMACIALMAVLVIAQVILRYVFNDPLEWSEEMARITFIYITFIGIGAAYGRRRHMAIDAVTIELPAKQKDRQCFGRRFGLRLSHHPDLSDDSVDGGALPDGGHHPGA